MVGTLSSHKIYGFNPSWTRDRVWSEKVDSYKPVLEAMASKGIEPDEYRIYTEHYKTGGVPPHGGIGTRLECIVQSYLSLRGVRLASLYPRDSMRLIP